MLALSRTALAHRDTSPVSHRCSHHSLLRSWASSYPPRASQRSRISMRALVLVGTCRLALTPECIRATARVLIDTLVLVLATERRCCLLTYHRASSSHLFFHNTVSSTRRLPVRACLSSMPVALPALLVPARAEWPGKPRWRIAAMVSTSSDAQRWNSKPRGLGWRRGGRVACERGPALSLFSRRVFPCSLVLVLCCSSVMTHDTRRSRVCSCFSG